MWKKTSIIVTMANDNYPNGKRAKTFNNIVEKPTEEQIALFTQGLLMLSDGDLLYGTEVIKHNTLDVK
ncbi:hypothetical protein [Companilactobacillus alimentarius]|uniref:DUF1659 domain-containing protein n=1 Tax=Companilactobacillus alimentarius DSM 20249 TaxID=1423720 RepID=A0A2K9HJF0_9LACO|nr:hypothetical protein [Companilactobacillus alimentarius]AUI72508.1 hypothetical protein LA20249_10080 [Companilactobacillus alimentarius DSM 20249]KRK77723.1 hypothetical protein FC67_GL000059 [Companilactobacillus alimentarius DSM 20249]GEO45041.1 hypothetical protein LAL01_12730 [Companilactobacillus alimentarius]